MSRNGKVIVAMSGGVDSSVAACLLKEQGYDCVGVFMRVGVHVEEECSASATASVRQNRANAESRMHRDAEAPAMAVDHPALRPAARRLRHGCCSATDALDARTIAGRLGIPFYALNFRDEFERIIDYFVDEYGRGRTPNPCVQCNIHLKFGKLLRYADMIDAEFVATGHYARVLRDQGSGIGDRASGIRGRGSGTAELETGDWQLETGNSKLARAVNPAKDQSYVLFGIHREALPRCVFPIGEIADKREVRRIAHDLGLRVHDKPDSQEICFVPDQDYRRLVRQRRPELVCSGEIRDRAGGLLGKHDGVAGFTIGQRRGLGIAVGLPVYVTRLDPDTQTVTVGPREELLSSGLIADRINWLTDAPPTGTSVRCEIKIRHMHTPAAGLIRPLSDGTVEVGFDEPQSAVTPGQAAVFYDGDIVLGGGWIRRAV
jgi:tRNA-specific 2-thiouridylase